MPQALAVAERSDRRPVLDHVRDHEHLGEPLDERLAVSGDRRQIELTEPAAEGDHLRVGDGLIPEPQHLVVQPGPVDPVEDCVAHWSREVDAL